MIHIRLAHGCDNTVGKQPEAFFFIIQFALDIILQTFLIRPGEGGGIEAMLDGVVVAGRGTVVEGISVAGLATALATARGGR
jgi:hypothetical protein